MNQALAALEGRGVDLLAAFVVSLVASAVFGGLMRRVAASIGAVVPPRPDRWHNSPTPTMGGVAIALATVLGVGLAVWRVEPATLSSTWVPVVVSALAMFAIGVMDDRLQLSPLAKLVASLAIGAFLVFEMSTGQAAGSTSLTWTLLGTVWFAGVCHALNLLDNMDGLAAGVALIATLFLAYLLGRSLGPGLVVVLMALAGALVGFLYWNRPPARLFMGDSGSLFIGAVLASASLVPVFRTGVTFVSPAVLVVFILIVPLFDTAFVLVLRRLAGRQASKGGTDHVSHRLASLGFSERSAVRILYALGIIGGTRRGCYTGPGVEPMALVAVFAVLLTLFGIFLARVQAYNAQDFVALQKSSFAPFLKDLTFRWHAAEVLLDLVLITICYYAAYRIRFEGQDFDDWAPFFAASLPVVLGCRLPALYPRACISATGIRLGCATWPRWCAASGWDPCWSWPWRRSGTASRDFQRGVLLIDFLLLTVAIIITRGSFRAMNLVVATRSKRSRRVLVYGAGAFGQLLVREMRMNPHWSMNPIGFIDDDLAKAHRWIAGVPVRGTIEDLADIVRRHAVEEVVLSSPAINGDVEGRIRQVCAGMERPVRRFHMEIL